MHYHQNLMFCTDSNWYDSAYLCNHMVSVSRYEFVEDWVRLVHAKMNEYDQSVTCLNDDVMLWLEQNVRDSTDKALKDQPKGWDIGSDEYRSRNYGAVNIFFLRRRDAFAFIKQWSVYEKPTTYCNYFKNDRRVLVNGKLIPQEN